MLLVLHLVWTYMILQVAIQTIRAGKMTGDVRSSSDDDVSDSSENRDKQQVVQQNGTPKKENNLIQRNSASPKKINQEH